jgi:hypothetical protein
MATQTTALGYHCSPDADFVPAIGGGKTLCVADDAAVASLYLRGGKATHYLHTFAWDAGEMVVADERAIVDTYLRVTGRREYDPSQYPIWDVVKMPKVFAALVAEGYDALVYEDSHEGCNYTTTEFLRQPASLRLVETKQVGRDEE